MSDYVTAVSVAAVLLFLPTSVVSCHRVPSFAVGVADSKSDSASPHKPAMVNEALLLEDANATLGAADLMIRLLKLRPLSPRPPLDDDFGVLPAQSHNQIKEGNNAGQHRPAAASTPAQALHQPAVWPTPKPTEWHDIKLVAIKACMSLDWALSLRSAQLVPAETLHRLTAMLCQLIQRLVAGHLPDLDLNMENLFTAGQPGLHAAQLEGHAECTGLAAAMLARLAVDSKLVAQGTLSAGPISSIFCKSPKATCATCHVVQSNSLVETEPLHMSGR